MTLASVTQIAADFGAYLKASQQGPVVVTRHGKPIAVLLSTIEQDELERILMGHSPQLQAILEAARNRFRAGEGIPHDTFWKEIEAENARVVRKKQPARKNSRANRSK